MNIHGYVPLQTRQGGGDKPPYLSLSTYLSQGDY
jgi:hypothetical protein